MTMRRSRLNALLTMPLAAALAISTSGAGMPEMSRAQEATPAAECPLTTPEENVDLAMQWFAALAEGNSDGVQAIASPDLIYHAPSPKLPPLTDCADTWAYKRLLD